MAYFNLFLFLLCFACLERNRMNKVVAQWNVGQYYFVLLTFLMRNHVRWSLDLRHFELCQIIGVKTSNFSFNCTVQRSKPASGIVKILKMGVGVRWFLQSSRNHGRSHNSRSSNIIIYHISQFTIYHNHNIISHTISLPLPYCPVKTMLRYVSRW